MEIERLYSFNKGKPSTVTLDGEKVFIPRNIEVNNGPAIYDVYDTRSGFRDVATGVGVVSPKVNFDELVCCSSSYIVGIDTEKSVFSVSNTQKSSKDSELPIAAYPFIKRPLKMDKWCSAFDSPLLFFSIGQKLYALNLTDYQVISLKYDLLSIENFDKRGSLSTAVILGMFCHPTKPVLGIILSSSSFQSIIVFMNYSSLLLNLVLNEGIDDAGDTESISETVSVVSSSVANSSFANNKSNKNLDLIIQAVIKPPSIIGSSRALKYSFHKSGLVLAIAWERDSKHLALYNMQSITTDIKTSPKAIEPMFKPMQYNTELTCTGMCFHPLEPILFQSFKYVSNPSRNTDQFIRGISLLHASMPCLVISQLSEFIPIDLTVSDIACSRTNGKIIVSLMSPSRAAVAILSLSQFFLSQFSVNSPVTTNVSIPPDAYVNGDQAVKHEELSDIESGEGIPIDLSSNDSNGQNKNQKVKNTSWPIVISAKKIFAISSGGFTLSYDFFRTGLGLGVTLEDSKFSSSANKDFGIKHLGSMGSLINDPNVSASYLSVFQPEDRYFLSGVYIIRDIKLNDFALNSPSGFINDIDNAGSGNNPNHRYSFEIILRGTIIPSTTTIVAPTTAVVSASNTIIGLGRYERVQSSQSESSSPFAFKVSFSSYRDAQFWTGPTLVSKAVSKDWPSGILALSNDGLTVKWIQIGTTSTSIDNGISSGKISGTWRFESEMRRLWTSPIGAPNLIIYASQSVHPIPEILYISMIGAPNLEANPTKFTFRSGETVLEALWQPIATAFGTRAKTTDIETKNKQVLFSALSESPLLGILTNYRLLIFSTNLEILNCIWHNTGVLNKSMSSQIEFGTFDSINSISWVASALVYSTSKGAVSYLLPILKLRHMSQSNPSSESLMRMRSCGLREEDFGRSRLCTLANCFSFIKIIAILPDRMVFAATDEAIDSQGLLSKLILNTMPMLPIEPVILGLLVPRVSQGFDDKIASSVIKPQGSTLKPTDFSSPIKLNSNELSDKKEKINANRTEILIKLSESYFKRKFTSDGNILPPTGISTQKLIIALSECGYNGIASIVAGVPSDSDARSIGYSSSNFPTHRWISPALKFDVANRSGNGMGAALALGYGNTRTNIYDRILDPSSLNGGLLPHRDSSFMRQLHTAAQALLDNNQKEASDRLVAICNQSSSHSISSHDIAAPLFIDNLYARPTVSLQPTKSISQSFAKQNEEALLISSKTVGQGLGPPSLLPKLSMAVLEDLLGLRSKPDGLTTTNSIAHRILSSTIQSSQLPTSEPAILPGGMSFKPDTWVSDIGQGKDLEKVVGYWRFSDACFVSEPGFANSSLLTRMVFTDLSKYAPINNLELLLSDEAVNNTKLEISTCNVDPGEDHEKIKALYDIVYPRSANSQTNVELKMLVGRGGPLDVGLFHQDTDRCKLTLEMMVYCGPIESNSLSILIQRQVYPSSFQPIYRLAIDPEGRLVWSISENSSKPPITKKSEPGALFQSAEGSTFEWKHVVLELSSHSISSSSSLTVQVIVNNTPVMTDTTVLNMGYLESELETTSISFGVDLPQDWRLTELRAWSDVRSSTDLDESRDNHLGLASKRKRQQMRLKGTKELFRPIKEGYGNISNVKATDIRLPVLKSSLLLQPESDASKPTTATKSNAGDATSSTNAFLKSPLEAPQISKRTSIALPPSGSRLSTLAPPALGRRGSQAVQSTNQNATSNANSIADSAAEFSSNVFGSSIHDNSAAKNDEDKNIGQSSRKINDASFDAFNAFGDGYDLNTKSSSNATSSASNAFSDEHW